jgi:hypothetical protein
MANVNNRRCRVTMGFCFCLAFIGIVGLPAFGHTNSRQTKVQVEKKPKYISAGRGQAPFNVTRHLIPLGEIRSGGPPKDGIPALTDPAFVSASEANRLLRPSDFVLGVDFEGVAKAYPIRILNWHEIVNDELGRQPVLVSW